MELLTRVAGTVGCGIELALGPCLPGSLVPRVRPVQCLPDPPLSDTNTFSRKKTTHCLPTIHGPHLEISVTCKTWHYTSGTALATSKGHTLTSLHSDDILVLSIPNTLGVDLVCTYLGWLLCYLPCTNLPSALLVRQPDPRQVVTTWRSCGYPSLDRIS